MHISLINKNIQSYESTRWQQFLIYIGLTLGAFIINAFMNSILPVIYRGACTGCFSHFDFVANVKQSLGLSVDSRLYLSQSWPVPHPTTTQHSKSKIVACLNFANCQSFVFCNFVNQTGCEYSIDAMRIILLM